MPIVKNSGVFWQALALICINQAGPQCPQHQLAYPDATLSRFPKFTQHQQRHHEPGHLSVRLLPEACGLYLQQRTRSAQVCRAIGHSCAFPTLQAGIIKRCNNIALYNHRTKEAKFPGLFPRYCHQSRYGLATTCNFNIFTRLGTEDQFGKCGLCCLNVDLHDCTQPDIRLGE